MRRSSSFLRRDEYIDSRNTQDRQLNDVLTSIRQSIDGFGRRIDGIEQRFDGVERRMDGVELRLGNRLEHLELEMARISARFQNNSLRNPHLRIAPIVAYDPNRGIIQPDLSLYPRNANEFYALRSCRTSRHHKILTYLISLYDVPVQSLTRVADANASSSASDTSSDNGSYNEPNLDSRNLSIATQSGVVDCLEAIFGLDEDKFISFRQRASEMEIKSLAQPTKRHFQLVDGKHWQPEALSSRKVIPHALDNHYKDTTPSDGPESGSIETQLRWRTPSDAAATKKQILAHFTKQSDDGSITNANTSPRDARRDGSPINNEAST